MSYTWFPTIIQFAFHLQKQEMRAARVLVGQIMWSSCVLTKLKTSDWLDDGESDWLIEQESDRDRRRSIMNGYTAQSVCAVIFSPRAVKLVNTRSLSMSVVCHKLSAKERGLLSFFYTSTRPSVGPEKCGGSFPFDKSQVCSCGLSHTLFIKVGYHTRPELTRREERHVAYITVGH